MSRKPNVEIHLIVDRVSIGWARAMDRGTHDVVHVIVEEPHRKRGHGRALVETVKAMAHRVWGVTRFRCECARDLRQSDLPENHAGWCSKRNGGRS